MLTNLRKAKLRELEEAYLLARMRNRNEEAKFWNLEIIHLLLGMLDDSGNSETTRGTDSGKQ